MLNALTNSRFFNVGGPTIFAMREQRQRRATCAVRLIAWPPSQAHVPKKGCRGTSNAKRSAVANVADEKGAGRSLTLNANR